MPWLQALDALPVVLDNCHRLAMQGCPEGLAGMYGVLAYHTAIPDLGGYIRDPSGLFVSGLLVSGHCQPFQFHMYGVLNVMCLKIHEL